MKILILGAGATGGYFGGRLAASGADVTFLVRPKRAGQLSADGLVIESPHGNLKTAVKVATASTLTGIHDVVILSCKAYDLTGAIEALRPAVGPATKVLPLLNGLKHLDALDEAFGADRVLGGSCHLSVALDDDGTVRHFNQLHLLTYGPRTHNQNEFCSSLHEVLARADFDTKHSPNVMQSMWDKWVLLASLAALTCLFRASIGEISSAQGGRELMLAAIEECRGAAKAEGFEPSEDHLALIRTLLTDPASPVVASMYRDMQRGGPIEGGHIVGDILARGRAAGHEMPVLATAYVNLQCYQNRLKTSG
jgi:2-dehydropantoate 2-reductase